MKKKEQAEADAADADGNAKKGKAKAAKKKTAAKPRDVEQYKTGETSCTELPTM